MAVHSTSVLLSFIDAGLLEVDDFFKDCMPTSQTIPSDTQEPPNLEARTNLGTPSKPAGSSDAEAARVAKGKGAMVEETMAESPVAPRESTPDAEIATL